jgi:hypothetical protein
VEFIRVFYFMLLQDQRKEIHIQGKENIGKYVRVFNQCPHIKFYDSPVCLKESGNETIQAW